MLCFWQQLHYRLQTTKLTDSICKMNKNKPIEHYFNSAKQESVGFTQENLRGLVESAPTAVHVPTSTLLQRIITMTAIGLTITGLCTAVWLWVSPQETQSQATLVHNQHTSAQTQKSESITPITTLVGTQKKINSNNSGSDNFTINSSGTTNSKEISQKGEKSPNGSEVKGLPISTIKGKLPFAKPLTQRTDNSTNKKQNYNTISAQQNTAELLSTFTIPEELSFCDEKVPLDDIEVRERVDREFISTLQQSGKILMYLKRAQRWFPVIEKILKEENMHDDLKYLCVAESELTQARSPIGALGFWQFMEETALQYGMRVNEYVDERMNVEKSTRAACKYFRNAKVKLSSWTMCAAGYNQGITGTERAIDFQGTNNFFDLYLNEETSRYVLRIAVIKYIMSHSSQFGYLITDDVMYQPYNIESVAVTSAIPNLNNWANEHNTTYKYIKLLNPWLKKSELPAPPQGEQWNLSIPKQ